MSRCTCRGYDPADPCMHGDTSEGCPVHDPDLRLRHFGLTQDPTVPICGRALSVYGDDVVTPDEEEFSEAEQQCWECKSIIS